MKKTYKLENLECPSCAAKMEESIKTIDGVKDASVNFMVSKLKLEVEGEIEPILTEAQKRISLIERDCKIIQ